MITWDYLWDMGFYIRIYIITGLSIFYDVYVIVYNIYVCVCGIICYSVESSASGDLLSHVKHC